MEMHVFHLPKSKGSSQNKHTPEQNKFFKEGTAEETEGAEAWRVNTHIIQHMGEMQLQSKWCHGDITSTIYECGGGKRRGYTYFQQLAVLETAQQKEKTTPKKEKLRLEEV